MIVLPRRRELALPGRQGGFIGARMRSAARFSPNKLSGLKLWVNPRAISGLSDNDPIDSVADLSGSGNTLTAPTSGKRPLYKLVSGVPWMRFDGIDDRLTAAGAILPSNARCTILMVLRPTVEAVVGTALAQYAASQTGRLAFVANQNCNGSASSGRFNPFIANSTNGACTGGGAGLPVDFAYTRSPPSIISYTNTGGSEGAKVRRNGVEQDSFTSSAIYTGAAFSLGRDASEALGAYDGDIGEVIVYEPELTSDQLTLVESYLASRWSIDPYAASVVALLNFPGADASTTFEDATGRVWTANGNAQIDTSLGYNTGLFDGTNDWISTPNSGDFAFGSGEVTIDAIVRFNNYPVDNGGFFKSQLIAKDASPSNSRSWSVQFAGTASSIDFLEMHMFTTNTTFVTVTGAFSFALNTDYHVEACRDGNTLRLYVDGVQVGSAAYTGSVQVTSSNVKAGSLQFDATFKYDLNGHIRALRVTKGVCRHPGGTTFTPPTAPFPEF